MSVSFFWKVKSCSIHCVGDARDIQAQGRNSYFRF